MTMVESKGLPPLRVASMNMAGVKGPGRLEQVFAAARRERVDALMGQEHGLHTGDEERLHTIAHDHGYRVEMSPIPSGTARGGTWVALNMHTFRLTRSDPIPKNRETIGGGVTVVRVPKSVRRGSARA